MGMINSSPGPNGECSASYTRIGEVTTVGKYLVVEEGKVRPAFILVGGVKRPSERPIVLTVSDGHKERYIVIGAKWVQPVWQVRTPLGKSLSVWYLGLFLIIANGQCQDLSSQIGAMPAPFQSQRVR